VSNALALLLWGLVVGLDLVSIGQFMIARPLVAGTVAGLLVGDPGAGVAVGLVLELFALDVMPVGAVRYPDYGLGAIAATAAAAGAPGELALGLGVVLGLVVAMAGEFGSHLVREANAAATMAQEPALAAGDARTVNRLHGGGLLRDGARALIVCGLGLALAAAVRSTALMGARAAVLLGAVMVGCAIGTAATGALRVTGRREHVGWLAAGVAAGLLVVMIA